MDWSVKYIQLTKFVKVSKVDNQYKYTGYASAHGTTTNISRISV